ESGRTPATATVMSELSALSPAAQARASTCGSVHRHEERDLVAIDGAPDLAVRFARGIQDAVEGERALVLAAVGLLASALVVCLHDRHLRVDRVGREVAGGVAGDRDVVGEADGAEVDRGGGRAGGDGVAAAAQA